MEQGRTIVLLGYNLIYQEVEAHSRCCSTSTECNLVIKY